MAESAWDNRQSVQFFLPLYSHQKKKLRIPEKTQSFCVYHIQRNIHERKWRKGKIITSPYTYHIRVDGRMCSQLVPFIVNIVWDTTRAYYVRNIGNLVYPRYVFGTCSMFNNIDEATLSCQYLNSLHPSLLFRMEEEENNSLSLCLTFCFSERMVLLLVRSVKQLLQAFSLVGTLLSPVPEKLI